MEFVVVVVVIFILAIQLNNMAKYMEEICEEIESDGNIEDFAKDIILNQENFENNLYLFDKYIQGFDSTKAANYYTRRYGEKFDVFCNKRLLGILLDNRPVTQLVISV